MSGTWIDRKTLVRVTGWASRTVRHKENTGELKSRVRTERESNGRPVKEFDASSLPAELQLKLAHDLLASSRSRSQALALNDSQKTLPLFESASALAANIKLVLTPEEENQADQRHIAIQPLLDWKNERRPNFSQSNGIPFSNTDQLELL